MARIIALTWLTAIVVLMLPLGAAAQSNCEVPALSEQQVGEIIAKERVKRADLPPKFDSQTIAFRRQGCHYTYIEYFVPRTPEKQNIFKLNQHGIIVDVQPGQIDCPKQVFTEAQLAAIVEKARAERKELPRRAPNTTARVDRLRCLYLYFEEPVPPKAGHFVAFTIDPLGELLDVMKNP